jgi:shikimate 5-dehydrogenase
MRRKARTLPSIKSLFPDAHFFSQRTGQLRDQAQNVKKEGYDLAIWAAGPRAEVPSWKAKVIYDLNYREDSRAKEWSLITGAKYISGLGLFKAQALEQQKLWRWV